MSQSTPDAGKTNESQSSSSMIDIDSLTEAVAPANEKPTVAASDGATESSQSASSSSSTTPIPLEGKEQKEKKIINKKEGDESKAKPKKKKKPSTKHTMDFRVYIHKLNKKVNGRYNIGLSCRAMSVFNTMMSDVAERLMGEAGRLCRFGKKATLSSREIQTSCRLVLPGELAKHACSEGVKAVTRFTESRNATPSDEMIAAREAAQSIKGPATFESIQEASALLAQSAAEK
jgi:histone H2B